MRSHSPRPRFVFVCVRARSRSRRPSTGCRARPSRRSSTASSTIRCGRRRRCRRGSGSRTTRIAATRCRTSTRPTSASPTTIATSTSRSTASTTSRRRSAPTSPSATPRSATTGSRSASIPPAPARRRITCSPIRARSQMDALNTSASGEQFDADMVWFSAAKTTSDGYVVEVQIPLQTLRFSGGDEVKMNLVFFRKVSRIGYSYAWPEMLPGQWVFDRPSRLIFSNLKPRRLVEVLPSVTYGINQQRETASSVEPGRRQVQPRRERQARHHLRHHARRHDQSRLQPGRERRVPGAGQPALPGVLLGEAAVLHGRHGPVQHRRHRRRRQHAHGRAHAPHRRSDLRIEADRHDRQDDVRRVECGGRQPDAAVHDRGRAVRRAEQGDDGRPRDVWVAAVGLCRRHLHPHAPRRPGQPRRRRRPVAAAVGRALVFGDVPGVAHQRSRRRPTSAAIPRRRATPTRRAAGSAPTRSSTTTKTS